MSWRSKAIGKLKNHGGRLVIRCAQGEQPMLSVLQLHARSSRGICQTLVMKWMCERAHGRDFWDWLCPGGKLSVAAVANVAIQHIQIGTTNGKETYYDNLQNIPEKSRVNRTPGWRVFEGKSAGIKDYLRYYGQLATSTQLFEIGKANHYAETVKGKLPEKIGSLVRDEPPPNPAFFYAAMHDQNDASGHGLGVETLPGGQLQFYDPNLGEVAFESAAGFADWMKALGKLVYRDFVKVDYEWFN